MRLICCVCHRVKENGEWVATNASPAGLASHGYCPACASRARVDLALLRLRELLQAGDHPDTAVA